MSQLQLSLLGEPRVKHAERMLSFSTRKALALLTYLAVEGGLHSRKTLSEAFWPELDAEHGRAALRATLLELRKLFERTHEAGERDHLRIERDLLGIEKDSSLALDLRLVESASKQVERGGESLARQEREELVTRLEQVIRLVRGPFLAGFTLRDSQFFDDWASQHREYWHLRVYQIFDTLSHLYEQGGDVKRAMETVTRWLSFDPLNEEGYRRLMRLRFAQGDRAGALRAYARGRAVLAEQLQVEPEPETVALAKQIRHAAPLRASQARPTQSSSGQPPADLLDGPFLGRTEEFGVLIERYQQAQVGQPQLVLLQGETGIGKTRLASEFASWAQAQGASVLAGKALQTGRQLLYQPLIDILRHQMEQQPITGEQLSGVWLAELSRLLPELREGHGDLPDPVADEALGHNRVFEATARLIQLWAAKSPLLLLLDDMQWADTATLDLVLYLARSLAEQPAPVLLVFNLGTGVESGAGDLSTWLMALKRTRIPLTTRTLAAFTQEETQRFVQALVWAHEPVRMKSGGATEEYSKGKEVGTSGDALASFANWLYFQTQGQPLYLVEILKELMAREIIFASLQENGAWGLVLRAGLLGEIPVGKLIPASLRELIHVKLGQLTPAAWTLLVAGAALGQGLSFERLIAVAQLEEQEGLRALEELLRHGWLWEEGLAEGTQAGNGYAFPREMIRAAVYQEAGMARQRLVQQRVLLVTRGGVEREQGELHPATGSRYRFPETRSGRRTVGRVAHGYGRGALAKNASFA